MVMSKQLYSEEECGDIDFSINMLATDVERIDPETIETKAEAKAKLDNILMGLYNLADEMGVKL
jgi:hypothetical protein